MDRLAEAGEVQPKASVPVAKLDDPHSIGEALHGSRLGEMWKYRVAITGSFARSKRTA